MEKSCRKGEEDERNDDNNNDYNNNTKKKTALSSNNPAEAAVTWSELPLDTLGEIKKRLFWVDHVRFSSVCKSWMAAQHKKRAGDIFPWLVLFDHDDGCRLSYYMLEPSGSGVELNFSHDLVLSQTSAASLFQISYHITCHSRWLLISTDDKQCLYSYFSLFSLATHKVIQLPRLNWLVARTSLRFLTAVSTNPTDPDCVFLALHISKDNCWRISTFKHGHTQWTTRVYPQNEVRDVKDVVFIQGVFYFLFSGGRLGSYEVANMKLNVDYYSNTNNTLQHIRKFFKLFVLDEELVVVYYPYRTDPQELFTRRFDWSQKDWCPIFSLGERSVFLSKHSAFVDATNSYGVPLHTCDIRGGGDRNYSGFTAGIFVEPPDVFVQ